MSKLNSYREGSGRLYQLMLGKNIGTVISRLQGSVVSAGIKLEKALKTLSLELKKILFRSRTSFGRGRYNWAFVGCRLLGLKNDLKIPGLVERF